MTEDRVPVIDIRSLPDDLEALDVACKDWGFFQIVGHEIDAELRSATHQKMREFFALPKTEKEAIVRTEGNAWGYYDQELTKNVRDWKEIFDVGPPEATGPLAGATPQWPNSLEGFQATLSVFSEECERIARKLVAAIAKNLDVPPAKLESAFEPEHTSYLRLNHYPICADPAPGDSPTVPATGRLGISHHTDAGALTVLMQDPVPGLQVERNGRWHFIQPTRDALVINIGDIVQVWSNDRYKAPQHRVIANQDSNRYTVAFFFNPSYETNYAPLESVCSNENPARYRSINWGEFRAGRTAGDYADYGEEIQISRFRIETDPAAD